jgi:hypothetical protein
MTNILDNNQLETILSEYVDEQVDSWDTDTLAMYAKDMLRNAFRLSNGKIDESLLINELFDLYAGDENGVKEHLSDYDIDDETINKLIAE